ncbi:Cof-type HAD-IIB family hydrolase [Terrilactibacillus laevilacticus]|uniref:Cof-type HAD-IIB family hydrolase n=1 Tax=Terrilactibacillus laevilacticus TaxID=1380157 RepID=A0ABW5PV45_9BACI|nr:Cof-type HAD-IIB family hydrolase [Terrilactibacillus laevilacticus]
MSYKLVCSDIDGTIINSEHKLSLGTQEAAKILQQRQIPLVLVSARMPQAIIPLQKELGNTGPLICFSGALVLDEERMDGSRDILKNELLNEADVKEIYKICAEKFPQISFTTYNARQWYVPSKEDGWVIEEHEITGTPMELFQFDTDLYPEVNKILCVGPGQVIRALEAHLHIHFSDLTVYKSKPTYLEIMGRHVSKSSAIEIILERYHLTRKDVIAFGDNYNDIDMLKMAGLGIAMGNAPAEVKVIADAVTLSNDEEGIKVALEKYCFVS